MPEVKHKIHMICLTKTYLFYLNKDHSLIYYWNFRININYSYSLKEY